MSQLRVRRDPEDHFPLFVRSQPGEPRELRELRSGLVRLLLRLILAGLIFELRSIQFWHIIAIILTFGFGMGDFFTKILLNLREEGEIPA